MDRADAALTHLAAEIAAARLALADEAFGGPCAVNTLPDPAIDHETARLRRWFLAMERGRALDDTLDLAVGCWTRAIADPQIAAWLRRRRIPFADLAGRLLVGVSRCHIDGDRAVVIDAEGRETGPAMVTVAMTGGLDVGVCFGLIALDPALPDAWWPVGPLCEHVLGGDDHAGFLAGLWPERVRLFRSPLAWLRAGAPRHGYAVLEWDGWQAHDLLARLDMGTTAVVCDDDAHAAELRRRARPRRGKLKLEVAA